MGDISQRFHLHYRYKLSFRPSLRCYSEREGLDWNQSTAQSFSIVSGTYQVEASWEDPLLGGVVGAVPLSGHFPLAISAAILALSTIVFVVVAVFQLGRMDIS